MKSVREACKDVRMRKYADVKMWGCEDAFSLSHVSLCSLFVLFLFSLSLSSFSLIPWRWLLAKRWYIGTWWDVVAQCGTHFLTPHWRLSGGCRFSIVFSAVWFINRGKVQHSTLVSIAPRCSLLRIGCSLGCLAGKLDCKPLLDSVLSPQLPGICQASNERSIESLPRRSCQIQMIHLQAARNGKKLDESFSPFRNSTIRWRLGRSSLVAFSPQLLI